VNLGIVRGENSLTYFSLGGSVNPNTEIIPCPATFTFASAGFGR
jgi:hypothetical protein